MASSPSPPPPQGKDTLSIPASLLYRLGLPLTISTLYILSPATAIAVPFVAAPTGILLYQRSRTPPAQRPAHLETLIWTFLGAATLAPAFAIIVQSVLSYGTALLVFGDRTSEYIAESMRSREEIRSLPLDGVAKRAMMARSWPYLAYLLFFSFSVAGLPEELAKLGILKYLERRQNQQTNGKDSLTAGDYIAYASAIGLGFSFFENLGFIYAAATTDTRNVLLATAAERILYGTAAHVLTAVLTGVRMARGAKVEATQRGDRESNRLGWYQIILPSVLYHGAGNALLLGACAWDGQPGWVHPETVGTFLKYVVAPVVLMTGLSMQVKREMGALGVSWFGV